MRVLVAGSTGVIGRQVVPLLREVGHDVVELVRPGAATVRDGREVVGVDVFDRRALAAEVEAVSPDVVVSLLTAIPKDLDPRHLAEQMQPTNRLRTEATASLVAAAGAAPVVSESLAYAYLPAGEGIADEDQPLWSDGPKQFRPVVAALIEHERLVTGAGGLVLRFGHLYGPGSSYAPDGPFTARVRAGKIPIVGDGGSVFSFTHAHDAATAIVAAIDKPFRGVLNVVDDEPTPLREWLPELAQLADGPRPKRAPKVVARLAVGGWGVAFMTALRGADNRRARTALDWRPAYGSWRDGFAAAGLGGPPGRRNVERT